MLDDDKDTTAGDIEGNNGDNDAPVGQTPAQAAAVAQTQEGLTDFMRPMGCQAQQQPAPAMDTKPVVTEQPAGECIQNEAKPVVTDENAGILEGTPAKPVVIGEKEAAGVVTDAQLPGQDVPAAQPTAPAAPQAVKSPAKHAKHRHDGLLTPRKRMKRTQNRTR